MDLCKKTNEQMVCFPECNVHQIVTKIYSDPSAKTENTLRKYDLKHYYNKQLVTHSQLSHVFVRLSSTYTIN